MPGLGDNVHHWLRVKNIIFGPARYFTQIPFHGACGCYNDYYWTQLSDETDSFTIIIIITFI
jgi:hypothetical protein